MKREAMKNANPSELTDDDLDIAIGALQEELETINNELTQVKNVGDRLKGRRTDVRDRIRAARQERRGR